MIREFLNTIKESFGISSDFQIKLILSILFILFLWFLRWSVVRMFWQRTKDVRNRYVVQKITSSFAAILGVLIIIAIWSSGIRSLATFLGIVSAGIAIALKETIANIAGWVFIIVRRPFTVGDRIQIGTTAGDVVDIRLFQFTILEIGNWVNADHSTGRIIHVNNGRTFIDSLANYTKGFEYIWNELPIHITFESDWKKAKEVLGEIIRKHDKSVIKGAENELLEASKNYMISYKNLTPALYIDVVENGIRMTIRYLCEPRKRRNTSQELWEEVLTEFGKHPDIQFAYPTTRFYNREQEYTSDKSMPPPPDGIS